MDIEAERIFFDVIRKVADKMQETVGPELREKVEFMWKRNMTKLYSKRSKRKPKPAQEGSGSDDEYLLPECNNVIYANLVGFRKERPFWKVKMTGGIYQKENLNEKAFAKINLVAKSDFFND